jgi:Plasmid encoded RepA protein
VIEPLSPTPQKLKFLDEALYIQRDLREAEKKAKIEKSFLASYMIQCTLPYSQPKNNPPIWMRKNGDITFIIQQGYDINGEPFGFPSGVLPRHILRWINTEACRTKNRRLEFGASLTEFLHKLNLDSTRGGKGDARVRIKRALQQLLHARLMFFERQVHGSRIVDTEEYAQIASKATFIWDKDDIDQSPRWGSSIELSQEFFDIITVSAVPCGNLHLNALKNSCLGLDLLQWSNWKGYSLMREWERNNKAGEKPYHWVSWHMLSQQLGANFAQVRNLQRNVQAIMPKIKALHPDLEFDYDRTRGGLIIFASPPIIDPL